MYFCRKLISLITNLRFTERTDTAVGRSLGGTSNENNESGVNLSSNNFGYSENSWHEFQDVFQVRNNFIISRNSSGFI